MKLLIIHLAIGVDAFLVGVSIELVFTANRYKTNVTYLDASRKHSASLIALNWQ